MNHIPSNIIIGKNLGTQLQDFLSKHNFSSLTVVTDSNTVQYCYPLLKPFLPENHHLITVPAGEENKHLGTCQHIWGEQTKFGLDRKALQINLGGGVIGDMGGFCAATYKRGIEFIQIPTTLLSMVDASVGGKLGVDFQDFKNHIGVFQNPLAVFIDTQYLQTLPIREIRSGYAEVLKHTLIADNDEWLRIKDLTINDFDWTKQVEHQINIKAYVTTTDPTEKGLRKILNFGHTLGHAVESFYLNTENRLLHGEAIAIGMIMETWLSVYKGFISKEECDIVTKSLLHTYPKFEIPASDIDKIIELTSQDKKNENKVVKFSLLEKIGTANYDIAINENEMRLAIDYYQSL